MTLTTLEPFIAAGPWALVVLVVSPALLKTVVAIVALFKVPSDRLAAVLRALAELFRLGPWSGR